MIWPRSEITLTKPCSRRGVKQLQSPEEYVRIVTGSWCASRCNRRCNAGIQIQTTYIPVERFLIIKRIDFVNLYPNIWSVHQIRTSLGKLNAISLSNITPKSPTLLTRMNILGIWVNLMPKLLAKFPFDTPHREDRTVEFDYVVVWSLQFDLAQKYSEDERIIILELYGNSHLKLV